MLSDIEGIVDFPVEFASFSCALPRKGPTDDDSDVDHCSGDVFGVMAVAERKRRKQIKFVLLAFFCVLGRGGGAVGLGCFFLLFLVLCVPFLFVFRQWGYIKKKKEHKWIGENSGMFVCSPSWDFG